MLFFTFKQRKPVFIHHLMLLATCFSVQQYGMAQTAGKLTVNQPTANFGVSKSCIADPNQTVRVINFSKEATHFQWYFEGAEPAYFEGKQPPEIRYPKAGIFNIKLIATNEQEQSDTLVAKQFMRVGHSIDFSANVTETGCAPLMTTFTPQTTGCIRRYKWNFGDGSVTSSQASPMHLYTQNGVYDVKLTIMYEDGTKDSLIKKSYIHVSSLQGNYVFDKTKVTTNESVEFKIYTNAHVMLEPKAGDVQFAMKSSHTTEWDSIKIAYNYPETGFYEPIVHLMSDDGCMTTLPSKGGIDVVEMPKQGQFLVKKELTKTPKKPAPKPQIDAITASNHKSKANRR